MTVIMTGVENGCYFAETLAIIKNNIGKKVDVVEHSYHYWKTLKAQCGKIFLIHKKDCHVISP